MKRRVSLYEIVIDGRTFWCIYKKDVRELKKLLKPGCKPQAVTLIESDHRRMGQYLACPYNRMPVCSQDVTKSDATRRKIFGHNCHFPESQD